MSKTINIAELRATTQAVIAKGKEEERRRVALEQAAARVEADRKRILDDVRRSDVISQILPTVELRASQGRSHAVVMDLRSYEDYPGYGTKPDGSELQGVGADVFAYCLDAGLQPKVESWHDGIGVNGGEQIVVHW